MKGNLAALQCAFDMTLETAHRDFAITLKAIEFLREKGSMMNNELLFQIWNESQPKDLPIEAFWFLDNLPTSYAKAKHYQDTYKKKTGQKIPIVGIRFPTKSNPNVDIKEYKRKP